MPKKFKRATYLETGTDEEKVAKLLSSVAKKNRLIKKLGAEKKSLLAIIQICVDDKVIVKEAENICSKSKETAWQL